MGRMFQKFWRDESAVTAIEYALIGAAMAVMLVVASPLIATAVNGKFTVIINAFN